MPSLVASNGQSVDLPFKQVTIGSDPKCDIPMRADLGIAFKHVVLNVTPQGTWLQAPDLNQPVTVNGTRLVSAALQDGDVLTLGSVNLTFRSSPQAPGSVGAVAVQETAVPVPLPSAAPPAKPVVTVPGKKQRQVILVYGIPIPITPMTSIITGSFCLMVGISMIVGMMLYSGPVSEVKLITVRKELVSSQYYDHDDSSYTLLICSDGEEFSLPHDVRVDLGRMASPVIAQIGVEKAEYTPDSEIPPSERPAPHVVTLVVNGQSLRTLARHNYLKDRSDFLFMLFGPIFSIGSLWLMFNGFEERAKEKKERLG